MIERRLQPFAVAGLAAMLAAGAAGCRNLDEGITPIPGSAETVPGIGGNTPPPFPPVDSTFRSTFANNSGGGFEGDLGNPAPPPSDPSFSMDDGSGGFNGTGDNSFGEGVSEMTGDPLDEDDFNIDRNYFASNVVYFGFDLSSVDASEGPKIEEVATYLRADPAVMLKVEGHCDERGTEQYNLALGERRALSIRQYLVDLGIEPDRVQTISYGEAVPADSNTTEDAYARNRRGEFLLLTPIP